MRTLISRRFYAVFGRDRHKLRFAEVGHAERVVVCVDGTRIPLCNGASPMLKLTLGWSVPLRYAREGTHIEASFRRLWVEIDLPLKSDLPRIRTLASRVVGL